MRIDLMGRVRNTKLPIAHSLLPLFETVVNSIDAIREASNGNGLIEVEIQRGLGLFASDERQTMLPEIVSFAISDNGCGFTTENFKSFETLDSLTKARLGGKGVGRLVWLKAFDSATIESVYQENDQWNRRNFTFRPTAQGIEDNAVVPISNNGDTRPRTVVRLVGFHEDYREATPRTAAAIGRRIVEHCLMYYTLDAMPHVIVRDPVAEETIDLAYVYKTEFHKETNSRSFVVGAHDFTIEDVFLKPSSGEENVLHFCANKRVVVSKKLSSLIPHADRSFKLASGEEAMYWGCVSGDLLDQQVDAERTGFSLSREGELLIGGQVTWEQVQNAAIQRAGEFLAPHTEDAKAASLARIRTFVENEEPKYRVLLEHRPQSLANLPSSLTDERLEGELHKLLATWRHDAKIEARKKLEATPDDPASFAKFKEESVKALGDLQEVAKADLVDYVVHRATVLSFFEKLLGLMKTGKFEKEDALHGLFFPLRTTSDDVDYEDHNLWVLDETLAFHQYLASDTKFKAQKKAPVGVESEERPDLLIYNRRMAWASHRDRPFASIVIVEFKRPERDGYTAEDNPVGQVTRYIQQIRDGTAKNPDGSSIDKVPETVPFFCHIVATLSDSLCKQMMGLGFFEAPDGQGYFSFNIPLRAYIQVSSYDKVLSDALKRNRAFFEKLQIPVKPRRM